MAVFCSRLGRLPKNEYTFLQYIESSGTQYIDSGFVANQNTRVICRGTCPVSSVTNWLFGARTSGTSNQFGFVASASGYYLACYNTSQEAFQTSLNSSGLITVDINKTVTTLTTDNGTGTVTCASGTFTCPKSLTLFAVNNNGSIGYGKVGICFCKIYDNGTLVRDLWPALRNADGAIGMYDKVTDRLFTNAGTDEFIVGVAA